MTRLVRALLKAAILTLLHKAKKWQGQSPVGNLTKS